MFLASCTGSLSPLSHKLQIGQEPYVVFTADGEGGTGDLFASPAGGAVSYQVTFTRLDERLPRLSPDGSLLAFVRSGTPEDSASSAVWVMNLINGAERRVTDPGAADPLGLAWSSDSKVIYLRTGTGVMTAAAPPAPVSSSPAQGESGAAADSALAVLIGDPVAAEVVQCPTEAGLCLVRPGEAPELLEPLASEPVRWGPDSIAYLLKGEFVVRPLAGGTTRMLRWVKPLGHPRELTYFGPQ